MRLHKREPLPNGAAVGRRGAALGAAAGWSREVDRGTTDREIRIVLAMN